MKYFYRSPRCTVYGSENLMFQPQDFPISASLEIIPKTKCCNAIMTPDCFF